MNLFDYEVVIEECKKQYVYKAECCVNTLYAVGFAILEHDNLYPTVNPLNVVKLIELVELGSKKEFKLWLKLHGFKVVSIKEKKQWL